MKAFFVLFLIAAALSVTAQDVSPEPQAPVDETTPAVTLDAGVGAPLAATPAPRSSADDEDAPPMEPTVETPTGENIPKAHEESRYQAVWSKNPFKLKTVATNQTTVSFAQDWALAGMYRSPSGKVTVTVQNKQTSEYKRISTEDTDGDFRLVEAKFNRNRNEASVVIASGNQTAELKYDDALNSKPLTINNTLRAPEAAPGQPGAPVSATGGPGSVPRPPGVPPGLPRPGMPGAASGAAGAAPTVTPPSISRRRQLIPPPTVSPPPAQP